MNDGNFSRAAYIPPEAPLTERRAVTLLSPKSEEDFRASVKWMRRTAWVTVGLLAARLGFLLLEGWEWKEVSMSQAVTRFIGAGILMAGALATLPALRRGVQAADSSGDPDAALLESLKHQRLFWKRLIIFILAVMGATIAALLAGSALVL